MNKQAALSESKRASVTYTVDSFDNGIAFGQHRVEAGKDARVSHFLGLEPNGHFSQLRSRYALHHRNPLWELERHLMRLSQQGILGSSTIYFGTTTDPFFPFEGKFDASMKFLQLFQKYLPGLLVVQTRSPLLVIAMPVLRSLGERAVVTVPIETNLEESVRRYTPGQPKIEDRLRAVTALRRFGVEVTLQVSPVLPYGDWKTDAKRFAELLVENGDYVTVKSLSDGTPQNERRVRKMTAACRLAEERKFQWLRYDAAEPLLNEIKKLAPQKLEAPNRDHLLNRQLSIFAA